MCTECTGWEKIKIWGTQIQIKVEKYKEKKEKKTQKKEKNSEKGEKNSEKGEKNSDKCRINFRKCRRNLWIGEKWIMNMWEANYEYGTFGKM